MATPIETTRLPQHVSGNQPSAVNKNKPDERQLQDVFYYMQREIAKDAVEKSAKDAAEKSASMRAQRLEYQFEHQSRLSDIQSPRLDRRRGRSDTQNPRLDRHRGYSNDMDSMPDRYRGRQSLDRLENRPERERRRGPSTGRWGTQ